MKSNFSKGLEGRQWKIKPNLRMVSDGDITVNTIRAEYASALAVSPIYDISEKERKRGVKAQPLAQSKFSILPEVKPLKPISNELRANIFIELDDATDFKLKLSGEKYRVGNIITAQVNLDEIPKIAEEDNVVHISLGDTLFVPHPQIKLGKVSGPRIALRDKVLEHEAERGSGVMIGIIDVEGFDFAHPDFIKNGKTRFVSIWDQGGTIRKSPKESKEGQFDYGSLFTEDHLNAAMGAADKLHVSPHDIEPQSQMVTGAHGTHVASIAAGNNGMCPEADIVGVLLSLSAEDTDRRRSFYDSTRLAHAVTYLIDIARDRRRPISINISLGTNGHAHDASSPINRLIDTILVHPGRSITVAAGNAGQEGPQHENDFGYIMGRIHTSGRIPARGLDKDIEWQVVGNSIADLSENELEIWYEPQDRFTVQVKPPDSNEWIEPVEPGQYIENKRLDNYTFISIYNELYHPINGCNYISIYLSPFFSDYGIAGVKAGKWLVRLHGKDVRDGRFHAWIERDDPHPLGPLGPKEAWYFPSMFSEKSNVDNTSVSTLACGNRIVSVGNLDKFTNQINVSSSQGPTRDGRFKPDVCAPGTDIVAAKGFGLPNDLWISMSGTSMSSPYVTGVIGLMLGIEPRLTGAQILGIIKRTAKPLPGADYTWRDDAGFGVIDPLACLNEAKKALIREDVDS